MVYLVDKPCARSDWPNGAERGIALRNVGLLGNDARKRYTASERPECTPANTGGARSLRFMQMASMTALHRHACI